MPAFGKYYAFEIKDDCNGDLLIVKDGNMNSSDLWSIDTIVLENEVLESFKYAIRLVNKSKLQHVANPYLIDGMIVYCDYIDQQGNEYNYEVTLPIIDKELILKAEEEIFMLKQFQSIFNKYLDQQQLKAFENYIRSFALDKY